MRNNTKIIRNEQGFASIVIALVLIIVISLLTVAFAQLARREQQDALGKELSNQAYYSAESGINDAVQAIPTIEADPAASPTQCLSSGTLGSDLPNSTIGATNQGVSYTCVLVNLTPLYLVKDPLSSDSGWTTVFSTNTASPNTLSSITVNWTSLDGKAATSGATNLPPSTGAGSWNSEAVIEFSITPLAAVDRSSLINDTFTTYLFPSTSGSGTVGYAPEVSSPAFTQSNGCPNGKCSVTITGLDPVGSTSNEDYLVHVYDFYDPSNFSITNATDSGGNQVNFTESQAQIDSTGKAHEVVRRIQAVVPLNSTDTLPGSGMEVQNVCKRFSAYPGYILWDSLDPSCSLT